MFNPVQIVIDAFVEQLHEQYEQVYGVLEPGYPGIIGFIARLAMEDIANSDAPYHDMNHTIMVTLVGQEILRGKHISEGGVTPREWLHFIISLLCHDIGYVRGVCRGDGNARYVCDDKGGVVTLPDGWDGGFARHRKKERSGPSLRGDQLIDKGAITANGRLYASESGVSSYSDRGWSIRNRSLAINDRMASRSSQRNWVVVA